MTAAAERVGRYQLLEPIGVGPSGTVSRAKVFGVAGFERQFAIKRFHPDLTSTAVLAQALSAAARAYGSLEHPRIARMSEFSVAQGTTFTAVEFIAGLDALRLIAETRLAGTTLPAGGALALVSQAARAIGYAHGRGLTHLGLSPTNVMVNAEGDIKITDFGILSATLPQRPVDVPRLANRIPYLAPEQLANEATSAATDVFALGVLAFELVTGHRTFRGETPQQIAQSVMAGPPVEPPLPRPIVRVLQRCLARSPFERFPDARALADALDAALRVAPVPGTRKEIGAQVKQTMDRIAALHEGEMSGVLALNIGTGPIPRISDPGPAAPVERPPIPALGQRDSLDGELMSTDEFTRPGMPPSIASGLAGASRPPAESPVTVPDLPKPGISTVTGIAPPPIPVPQGVGGPQIPSPPPSVGTATLLGIPPQKLPTPSLPPVKPAAPGGFTRPAPGLPQTPKAADRPLLGPIPPLSRPNADNATRPGADALLRLRADGIARPGDGARPDAFPRPGSDSDEIPTRPGSDLAIPYEPEPEPAPADRPSLSSYSLELSVDELAEAADHESAAPEPLAGARDRHETVRGGPEDSQPTNALPQAASPLFDPTAGAAGAPASQLDADPGEGAPPALHGAAEAPHAFPDAATHAPPFPDAATHAPPFPDAAPPYPDAATHAPYGRAHSEAPPYPTAHGGPPGQDAAALAYPSATGLPPRLRDSGVVMPGQRLRGRLPFILGGIVLAAGLAIGGWFVYGAITDGDPGTTTAGSGSGSTTGAGTGSGTTTGAGTGSGTGSGTTTGTGTGSIAGTQPSGGGDAGPAAAPIDGPIAAATPDAPPPDAPKASSDLSIISTPAGARVFLDGADAGLTPLKLPGTPDRHTIALLLAGHELYIAQVDGHGQFTIPLKEVTPSGDFAGIKVIKCKDKERYYVYVDGKASGMTCPTERIYTSLGPHTVEVYDLITETRRKWEINIKDGRISYRIRIDP